MNSNTLAPNAILLVREDFFINDSGDKCSETVYSANVITPGANEPKWYKIKGEHFQMLKGIHLDTTVNDTSLPHEYSKVYLTTFMD
jgi:hypothetical protein